MEKEIDDLFLNMKTQTISEIKIENLKECSANFPKLHGNLKQIKSMCTEIFQSLKLYSIKLESLATEMKDIESENTRLENEIEYQTSIYEHLKDLLINIEIKKDNFIALESESFESIEGLVKIEKALDILNSFHVDDYDIKIVREKKERVNEALRTFYKRFINYMSNFLARSEGTGELTIHKGLYGIVKRFKPIFIYSKRYSDCYTIIAALYIAHSRKLYEREFGFHLKTVRKLLIDSYTKDKIEPILETLFEMYKSIIDCEKRFLKLMEINEGLEEIFKNTNVLITEFVNDLLEEAEIIVLNILNKLWVDVSKEEDGVYYLFQEDIKKIYYENMELMIEKEKKFDNIDEGIEKLENVLKISEIEELNEELININITKIMNSLNTNNIDSILKSWFNFHKIFIITKKQNELIKNEDKIKEAYEKQCIDFVFSGDLGTEENTRDLMNKIEGDKVFKSKVARITRSIIVDNIDEDEKRDVIGVLNKYII